MIQANIAMPIKPQALAEALRPITERVRTDATARRLDDGTPIWTKQELTPARLVAHVKGEDVRGCAFIPAGGTTCRAAVLDFDDHRAHDGLAWADIAAAVGCISKAAEAVGLAPIPFRSRGGRGAHVWFIWDEPQDVYSLRQALIGVLEAAGFSQGTGGLAKGQVELYPKQDSVRADGFGSQCWLPLAGESVPLDPTANYTPVVREEVANLKWRISRPVPVLERPCRDMVSAAPTGELARFDNALAAVDDVMGYDDWLKIGMALHHESDGRPDGLALWDKHSARWSGYEGFAVLEMKWETFGRGGGNIVTGGTILARARETGWEDPTIFDDFEVLPAANDNDSGLAIIDPTTLSGLVPPERRWLVQGWVPSGFATGLYGDGGTGKSLLAMQLLTAVGTGTPFCGLRVEPGKALGVFCEDAPDELHRRQESINAATFTDFGELQHVRWLSRVGEDNILMAFENGRGKLTPFWHQVRGAAKAWGAKLLVLDNAADLFGGNENSRSEVRQFVQGACTRLAQEIDGAVVLLAHPSREGLRSGSGDSGSTAWNGAFRSRLYFKRPDDVNPLGADLRVLAKMKANYSSVGDELRLEFAHGCFQLLGGGRAADPRARLERLKQAFLAMLEATTREGRPVSSKRRSGNYAPKMFDQRIDNTEFSRAEMERAMEALITDGKIRVGTSRNGYRNVVEALEIC